MKSTPLRQLLREPTKVKRITAAGRSVQRIVQPAIARRDNAERAKAIDELLDGVLREPFSSVSLSKLVKNGRR